MDVLVTVFVRLLETIFAAGILGSAIVLILTTVEDMEIMFERDSDEQQSVIEERY